MTLKRMGWVAAAVLSARLMGTAQSTPQQPLLTGIEHVSLSIAKGNAEAEFEFLGKLGFEQALNQFHNASGKVSGGWGKVNDNQFILFEEPYTPSAIQIAQAGPTRAEALLPPTGFFHFCYLTPNVSAVYAKWAAAGLNPTQVHIGEGYTLETEIDDPEIILHNPGGDHGEAMGYVKDAHKESENSAQVREKGQHLGANRISDLLLGVEIPVDNVPLWQKFYERQGLVASRQGANVRMSFPGVPDQEIVLRPAGPNETYINATRILFSVKDKKKAAEQLRSAGLDVKIDKNEAAVHDTAGNVFVFVQR